MTTKEKIEVMQGWVDGKDIQMQKDLYWETMERNGRDITWDWRTHKYRIKPEPKPITREEITAHWVRDNGVKVGDTVRVTVDGAFLLKGSTYKVKDIKGYCIACEGYAEEREFNVEDIKKVTIKVVQFSFEDRYLFRGKWVRNKNANEEFMINWINECWISVGDAFSENGFTYSYDESFDKLEFIDGKPFGKEVWS